jgi:hypothetical protein
MALSSMYAPPAPSPPACSAPAGERRRCHCRLLHCLLHRFACWNTASPPLCSLELNLEKDLAAFCSQECFKASWTEHKKLHKVRFPTSACQPPQQGSQGQPATSSMCAVSCGIVREPRVMKERAGCRPRPPLPLLRPSLDVRDPCTPPASPPTHPPTRLPHPNLQPSATEGWHYCTRRGQGRSLNMPDFKWTGPLRPARIGPMRPVSLPSLSDDVQAVLCWWPWAASVPVPRALEA